MGSKKLANGCHESILESRSRRQNLRDTLQYFKKFSSITASMTTSIHDDSHPCINDDQRRQRRRLTQNPFSTMPKHAEGCRSCHRDTPHRDTLRARKGSSVLRFLNGSTTPKHAEGCRSCHRDAPRTRRGSSVLHFDHVSTTPKHAEMNGTSRCVTGCNG